MSLTNHLTIQSDPKHLSQGRRFIEQHAKEAGFDELTVSHIVLAVDEAVANIIRHSYEMKPDCNIEFKVLTSPEEFTVTLRDFGKKCDPSKIVPRPLHEIRPGGLGTHFINTVMDVVKYHSREQGTEMVMTKKRTASKR